MQRLFRDYSGREEMARHVLCLGIPKTTLEVGDTVTSCFKKAEVSQFWLGTNRAFCLKSD